MTAKNQRPKNREVENEMIRKPVEDHVPPAPATEPETGRQDVKNKRSNHRIHPL